MKYYVTLDGRTAEVDLGGDVPLVDGEPLAVSLETVPGGTVRSLLSDGWSATILAEPAGERGRWVLTVEGRRIGVDVVDERARSLRELAGGAATTAGRSLTAPMPGLVLRIEVEIGQIVKAGQGVLIVEAMKMENELKAPADAIVTAISVEAGQSVEKGALLVTFGDPAGAPGEKAP